LGTSHLMAETLRSVLQACLAAAKESTRTLLADEVEATLLALASTLPRSAPCGGLECRLSGNDSRVDFSVCMDRRSGGLVTDPRGSHCERVVAAWLGGGPPWQAASRLWLEFDLPVESRREFPAGPPWHQAFPFLSVERAMSDSQH